MRIIIKYICLLFIEKTNFKDHLASLIAMVILTILIIVVSNIKGVSLSFFPKCFNAFYVITTIVAVVLLVSTLLFALWHLEYIDSIAIRVDTGLANAMLWKVFTGLCYGIYLVLSVLKPKIVIQRCFCMVY
jgi:hypothetical protein